MSNETDLDWLARNVHVWPEGMLDTLILSRISSNVGWITKDQWLARRAELQNKPSWNDAPEWAEWLAQDEDGEWKWLAGLPGKYVDGWTAVKIKGCCKGLALGDWRDTLEKRPEEFQPFTSIEDNQEKAMKQNNGWFERGELPPVGAVCLYVISDRRSTEVEITAHAKLGLCFVEVGKSGENYVSKTAELHRFRPIRTERDDLVDVLTKAGISSYAHLVADAILAAGYRKESK